MNFQFGSYFDIIANLPLIFLVLFFLIVFILFLWSGVVLLTAKGDPDKTQRGREILLRAFLGLILTLLTTFSFYLISYFLKKGEVFQPKEVSGELPSAPLINFPPPPQFIKIGGYYFNGPWLLKNYTQLKKQAVFAILCKKNDNYDIISVELTSGKEQLLESKQYSCWLEKCNKNFRNLYIAIIWISGEKYTPVEIRKIKEGLVEEIKPSCSSEE